MECLSHRMEAHVICEMVIGKVAKSTRVMVPGCSQPVIESVPLDTKKVWVMGMEGAMI